MSETTIFRGTPSLVTRLGPMLAGGIVLLGALAAIVWWRDSGPAVLWLLGGIVAAAAAYLVFEVVMLNTVVYEVTSERIRVSRGLLTRRTDELELYRANDTTLIEPMLFRLLGLGTIEVRTMEEGKPMVEIAAVRGARALREHLRTHIEACRDRKRVRMAELDPLAGDHGGLPHH